MGHTRLGTLPDTRPWRKLVVQLADGASAVVIAGATSEAAVHGLELAEADPGLAHVVYLLAHTVLAARDTDFSAALATQGINAPTDPGLFDLTSGFMEATREWHKRTNTPQSDLSEMAALAAVEALTSRLGERGTGLFPSGDDIQRAAREFSTRSGFATLGHEFYSRLTQRFLLYHLGRELSQHVGGNGRFSNLTEHAAFLTDLDRHSREVALIVKEYVGDWYSKAKFEEGISERQARRFANHSLKKLREELTIRGAKNG